MSCGRFLTAGVSRVTRFGMKGPPQIDTTLLGIQGLFTSSHQTKSTAYWGIRKQGALLILKNKWGERDPMMKSLPGLCSIMWHTLWVLYVNVLHSKSISIVNITVNPRLMPMFLKDILHSVGVYGIYSGVKILKKTVSIAGSKHMVKVRQLNPLKLQAKISSVY